RIDATSAASLAVARSFASTIEKLEARETASIPSYLFLRMILIRKPVPIPDRRRGHAFRDHAHLLRRRLLPHVPDRENAGDGSSAADGRIELDRTTMQLDEGTHDREPKPRAAMLGTERVALETVEHPLAERIRDARAPIRHAEDHDALAPRDGQPHDLAGGREAHRV